ncbi:DEAD/DEAH box helicase [Saccharothrix australiensis]|uniref:AAA domain-containing protein n=1 Tax=Saccharothrix australiensis TaxID=2072 RepID=A0A495VWQ6_9PSEU|nr:AAA domain-containing protein [Saccharothrix australiensis]RKT53802.1 AAA domain-containing protein [Saccharothrix australiensis]
MRFVRLPLDRVLHLVASAEDDQRLREKHRDHPGLPHSVDHVVAELSAARAGVPATVAEPNRWNGGRSLLVHGTAWVARLVVTHSGRGYQVRSIDPLRVRDHHRLARHYLALHPAGWRRVDAVRELGDGADACWPRVEQEWERLVRLLADRATAPALAPRHAEFLDAVERVVDANERIALRAAADERPHPYRAVRPVGEQRHGAHSVYGFAVVGSALPEEGAFVQVKGEQRGQVTRLDGQTAVVRFDEPVDWALLPKTGELVTTTSTVVFKARREAITTLRERRALNPHLLPAIVDAQVRPIGEAADTPTEELDPDQLRAFRRALAVEDLMLVLGPPGTGKTRVISQVANAAAVGDGWSRPPWRVLVTAQSNRAVDNVLPRLSPDLVVVRVGNAGTVTDEGRPYLVDEQARELRGRTLAGVAHNLREFDGLDVAERWAAELADRVAATTAALADVDRASAGVDEARRAVGGPARAAVDALVTASAALDDRLDRARRAVQRNARLRGRPLLGWWCRWRSAALDARVERLAADRRTADDALHRARRHLADTTDHLPEVRRAARLLAEARDRVERARRSASTAAHSARAAVGGAEAPPAIRDTVDPATAVGDLTALVAWLDRRLPLLRARARLLAEWHHEVSGATTQLHPELIRYAHVVAATAVGSASRAELSEVDFDLVVVDEAGQIGTADVLVPLVRARRAVLVGDERQLPPFLDAEVGSWGREAADPRIRDLLAKSALEHLVGRLPEDNVVPLTWQRRMPEVIAEFSSREFYGGRLRTARAHEHRDELFGSPLVFVDTSGLPERRRRERPARQRDHRQAGYHNPAEAVLLSRLAAHYAAAGREWAVIVPYTAQVKAVTSAIVDLIGQESHVRLNVGSVDAFQGGERDVVLYGFTRSNPDGNVGFLSELRRANVAFTRAKAQLVLVGDLATITRSRDAGFRDLARSLRDHVAERGEIRRYDEVLDLIGGR